MLKFFIPLAVIFLSCCNSASKTDSPQNACEHQKKADSVSLMNFSIELKKAVMARNMSHIADHFQFPFRYNPCSTYSQDNKQDSLISRDEFIATKYNDFFGIWFMETVSKGYLSYILEPDHKDGGCRLIFSYPYTFISKKSNCLKIYFSIEKIQGRYKFISSWTS